MRTAISKAASLLPKSLYEVANNHWVLLTWSMEPNLLKQVMPGMLVPDCIQVLQYGCETLSPSGF